MIDAPVTMQIGQLVVRRDSPSGGQGMILGILIDRNNPAADRFLVRWNTAWEIEEGASIELAGLREGASIELADLRKSA